MRLCIQLVDCVFNPIKMISNVQFSLKLMKYSLCNPHSQWPSVLLAASMSVPAYFWLCGGTWYMEFPRSCRNTNTQSTLTLLTLHSVSSNSLWSGPNITTLTELSYERLHLDLHLVNFVTLCEGFPYSLIIPTLHLAENHSG